MPEAAAVYLCGRGMAEIGGVPMTEQGDHSAVLDGLQLVVAGERDAVGSLTALPPDLFARAGEEIGGLRQVFAVCTDPMTEPFRTATERIDALQQHLDDLVRMRSQKILLLALLGAEGRAHRPRAPEADAPGRSRPSTTRSRERSTGTAVR